MLSGVTDCYQPADRELKLTRDCLEVALEFRHPIQLITKNNLILRDLDLIAQLAALNLIEVAVSLTTLDQSLTRIMEPRTSSPQSRLTAIKQLSSRGVPVTAMLAPVIPAINDHEIPELLRQAAHVGADRAGYIVLRLPATAEQVFVDWLHQHFPDRIDKVPARIAPCETAN